MGLLGFRKNKRTGKTHPITSGKDNQRPKKTQIVNATKFNGIKPNVKPPKCPNCKNIMVQDEKTGEFTCNYCEKET